MEDIAALINEIKSDQSAMCVDFPKIIHKENIDLSGFTEQKSDYTGVENEYINQSGCSDYGYHGTMAIPYQDYFIVFTYSE